MSEQLRLSPKDGQRIEAAPDGELLLLPCSACRGKGYVIVDEGTEPAGGVWDIWKVCPDCSGRGFVLDAGPAAK